MNAYLCIKPPNSKKYICKKFDDFKLADDYYDEISSTISSCDSSIITMNKYIPIYFHPIVIHYKLKQMNKL